MMDYKNLPSSIAQQLNELLLVGGEFEFTYTRNIDENSLYNEINKRLTALETSLETNMDELEAINNKTKEFRIAIEMKEEVLLRVAWLRRLYQAKEELELADTRKKTIQLRQFISPVQTCPLKRQLMTEIGKLEQSLIEESPYSTEPSNEQLLMGKAIEEAGDVFINLGKTGREFVVTDTLQRLGNDASVDSIKASALALEERVSILSDINDQNEMISNLEQLPLSVFFNLNISRKKMIADQLIKNNTWNGFADLDQQIKNIDRMITDDVQEKENAKNTIVTNYGKAAFTLNASDVDMD